MTVADTRCPMCGRPNPATHDACQFCGARIKPLVIRPHDERDDSPPPPPAPAPPSDSSPEADSTGEDIPDWLARIRTLEPNPPARGWQPPAGIPEPVGKTGPFPQPSTPPQAESDSGDDDWLSRIRPSAEEPADGAPPQPEEDWLSAIRKQAVPIRTGPLPGPAEDEDPSDWLGRLRTQHGTVEPRFPEPRVEPPSPEPKPEPAQPGRSKRINDLFKSQSLASEPELPAGVELPPPAEPELPDWLASIRRSEIPAVPESAAPPEGEEPLPDWLKPVTTDSERPAPVPSPEPEFKPALSDTIPVPPTADPLADDSAFDFLRASPAPSQPADDLAQGDLPEWLAAMRPDEAAPSAPVQERPAPSRLPSLSEPPVEALAPATLPSWLEAMRPLEVNQPVLADDDRQETSGPLAGIRGVLGAEPIVAMPRAKPPVQTSRLQISDAHAAQAELLRGLMSEEIRQKPGARRKRFDITPDRWLVTLALLAAVIVPTLMGGNLLPSPKGAPLETHAVFNTVDSLDSDAPVLLAFEYGPSSVGELDAAARALIDHLMIRGARLALVSSQPAGAALAQASIQGLAADHRYEYGRNYVHLGYLPGGSTGLLDFAIQPQAAVVRDYSGTRRPWDASDVPALAGVASLSDFRLIVLFASAPESARGWIEQVHTRIPNTPMIAVASAGAEALLRPYYESEAPQLTGLIVGLNGAAEYEAMTGRPAFARNRWDNYGVAILVATGLIAVGNLVTAVTGVLKRKREDG